MVYDAGMAYRRILAPLNGGARGAAVMATAIAAAGPFSGRIEALFVRPNPAEALPAYGEGNSGAHAQEMVDTAREAAGKCADSARKTFDHYVQDSGVEADFRDVQGKFAD